jgi:hypothetical protein
VYDGNGAGSDGHAGRGRHEQRRACPETQKALASPRQRKSVGQAQPYVPPYSQTGPICLGLSRAIDCKIFPPPIDVDPDRKIPKF